MSHGSTTSHREADDEELTERIRRWQEESSHALEHLEDGDAFFAVDREWRLTVVNHNHERLTGTRRENTLGRSCWDAFPDMAEADSPYWIELRRALRDRHEVHFDARLRSRDLWTSVSARPARGGGLGVFIRDETARRSARSRDDAEHARALAVERQARLDAEAAGQRKDEFLAMLSHELRTPLAAIQGWSQILCMGAVPESRRQHGMEVIYRNALVQAQIVEDLLDVSRIMAGKMAITLREVDPVDAVAAALETVRLSAEARSIDIRVSVEPGAGPVMGDVVRLQQVVWNLLSNAIKFTPIGGTVRVSLRHDGAHVELVVEDEGVGIPPSFIAQVFERFYQVEGGPVTRRHGLGLGLAIARHLVEGHGGTIEAFSAGVAQGARFTVRLPAAPATPCARPREI